MSLCSCALLQQQTVAAAEGGELQGAWLLLFMEAEVNSDGTVAATILLRGCKRRFVIVWGE